MCCSVRPDQYYTDVIARPMSVVGRRTGGPGPGREVEVVAEEEQQFLSRQQQYLAQGVPPSQGGGSMPPGVQKTPDRKVVGSPGVQGSPKKVAQSLSLLSLFLFILKASPHIYIVNLMIFIIAVEAWRK